MSLPEYKFTDAQLADYLDKARPMMVLAERERCAKIADKSAADAQEQIDRNNEYMARTRTHDDSCNALCRHKKYAAETIAREIRASCG